MASAFTHIFTAAAFGKTGFPERMPARFWGLAAVCSVLPDLDVLGFYFGIRYADVFGHRGFMHSLLFALILAVLVVVAAFPAVSRFSKRWWALIAFFFLVTASHGLLDALTDRGMGVAFLSPFDTTRYSFPWRPLIASPMTIGRFFGPQGVLILLNEIIWIWLPVSALVLAIRLYRRKQQAS